jgi:signal transduction histidine kinase
LREIERAGRTAQGELRVVLDLLRGSRSELEERTPVPMMADLDALVAQVRQTGTMVQYRAVIGADAAPAVQITVYRIVQESLTNCVKHAAGSEIELDITVDEVVVVIDVRNRVDHFAAARGPVPMGHGLVGMHERVAAFGGTLEAGPSGDVFRVLARIPSGAAR